VFNTHGTGISWKTSLRKVVTLLTTEAEYIAMIEVVKEALWLKGLGEELRVEDQVVIVYCDNISVI